MPKPVIQVESLSKSYKLGHRAAAYSSFREAMMGMIKAPLRNLRRLSEHAHDSELFWALRDVSFDVHRGEVIGVIGSNGAGKSTLLKILSRITEPTSGRAVLRGRVASLLEVGTGFHPELTGRENIYLNGSILGMRRAEITRKFDEIVAFSEIETFLDTPVKHYSSGMYVRLAFAVAAHLEPDVLVVDEVLAVGDAEFQRKCLGKMESVASEQGRTVLFVSHNMSAVQKLCHRGLLMRKGRMVADGPADEIVRQYLTNLADSASKSLTEENPERIGNGSLRLTGARLLRDDGTAIDRVVAGEAVTIELRYRMTRAASRGNVFMIIYNHMGTAATNLDTGICNFMLKDLQSEGTITCRVPKAPFPMGRYHIGIAVTVDSQTADAMPNLLSFEVETSHFFDSPRTPTLNQCSVMVEQQWNHVGDKSADTGDSGAPLTGAALRRVV